MMAGGVESADKSSVALRKPMPNTRSRAPPTKA
jgi:hypothetical protein